MSARGSHTPVRPRRRGSIYLATLGAAAIVTVLGLSALLAMRIGRRAAGATEAAVKAGFYAQSGLDLVLFGLANNPTWRYSFSHDTWSPEATVGEWSLSFKLVDEGDADLADDAGDPVRLYVKATVGDAVRICSVLLGEPGAGGYGPAKFNLLKNGDMESDTMHWTGLGLCDLESRTDGPHGGSAYIQVKNRTASSAGPQHHIPEKIASGQTYYTEVWVRTKDTPEAAIVRIYIETSPGGGQWFSLPAAPVQTTWTKLAGTISPTFSGSLVNAYWKVETASSGQEFSIDDAVLVKASLAPSISTGLMPVPGTWRQEVLP